VAQKLSEQKIGELARMVGMSVKDYKAILSGYEEAVAAETDRKLDAKKAEQEWNKDKVGIRMMLDCNKERLIPKDGRHVKKAGFKNEGLNIPEGEKKNLK